MSFLKWSIVKSVPGYPNITYKCLLCLHEKFEVISYPSQDELLNKRSELISKCCHVKKYLLSNSKSNDQSTSKILTEHYQFIINFDIIRCKNVSFIRIFLVKQIFYLVVGNLKLEVVNVSCFSNFQYYHCSVYYIHRTLWL